jgi:hypothetical protein
MSNALGLTEMTAAQAQKYVTVNNTTRYLTTLMTGARDIITALPTGVENACWIIGTAFTPYTINHILFYFGGAFYSIAPVEGLALWVWDEDCFYEYTGAAWRKRTTVTIPAAGTWKAFYSNASSVVTELSLGAYGSVLRSAGAAAAPEFVKAEQVLATVTADCNVGTKTTLFTVPTGMTLIVTKVVARAPSVATVANAVLKFGGDAGATDWKSSLALTGLSASTGALILQPGNTDVIQRYAAAGVFGVIASTTAVGTVALDVIGYCF